MAAFAKILLVSLLLTTVSEASELADKIEQGKQDNKYVLVIYSAPWCGPCQQLKTALRADTTLQTHFNNYICVEYNIDQSQQEFQDGLALIPSEARQNVIPCYILIDPYKHKAIRHGYGYRNGPGFIGWLRSNR